MPKDATGKKKSREELLTKYDVQLSTDREGWKEFHALFNGAQRLFHHRHHKWKRKEKTSKSKWRRATRQRAEELVAVAKRMQEKVGDKSEQAWRGMEPFMFKNLMYNSTWYDQSYSLLLSDIYLQ